MTAPPPRRPWWKKKRTWAALTALLFAAGTVVAYLGVHAVCRVPHVFSLPERPAFLTEELKLTLAREALIREGFEADGWRPYPEDRSAAPDGRPDRFATRDTIDPNQLYFPFAIPTAGSRFVSVELKGNRVTCQVRRGK